MRIEGKDLVVTWQAGDGYVSGKRPQKTRVPLEDLEGLSDNETIEVIDDHVTEDFREKIRAEWDPDEALRVLRGRGKR